MTIPPMYPAYPQQPVLTQQPWGPAPVAYPQQPQYQPPPQYQPQQQPQQPQQPQYQPQQPQGLDMNARLSGPQFPRELQGRTMQEAMQYYNLMREDFIRRQQAAQQAQPQGGQPQPQPQPQQQAPGTAQPRVPQQQDTMQQFVQDAVRQVMPEMLAPIIVPQQQRTMQETYARTAQQFPDWGQFDADIRTSLQGADAATLSNPAAWEAAYFHAKGKAMSRAPQGQPQAPYGAAPQNGNGAAPPMPPGYQQPSVPQWNGQQVQQQPQPYQTFVEGPTPQAPNGGPGYSGPADPRDEMFAKRFGIPVEVYRSGKALQGQTQAPVPMLRMPVQQQFNGGPQAPPPQGQFMPPQNFQPYGYAAPLPVGPNGQPIPPGFYNPNYSGGVASW